MSEANDPEAIDPKVDRFLTAAGDCLALSRSGVPGIDVEALLHAQALFLIEAAATLERVA